MLTSRRGIEAPGGKALVDRLTRLGAKATVVAGDVADEDSLKSIMEIFNVDRPLRGVFHAAGVSDAGVLLTLTPQRCVTTFAPKVNGAWYLHQYTMDMDLDLFVVFSSISGIMGTPGLGIYAAANAFLDALVHVRKTHGLPAISMAYGPLSGGGMAEQLLKTRRDHLTQTGIDPLTPDESLELLDLAVRSRRALTVAAALDLGRLQCHVKERGGIPPLLQSLLGQDNRRARRGSSLRKMLSETTPEQHASIVLRTVREAVAKTLGISQSDDVDTSRPLREIGVDSLTAILIRNQLATLMGLTLPANIVLVHPNLIALSQTLISQLQGSRENKPSDATASDDVPTGSVASPTLDIAAIRKGCVDPSFTFDNVAQGSPRPESVLVTGTTGFVGAFIVHQLLDQGIVTHCVVRANCTEHARHRMVTTLKHYGLWKPDYARLLNPLVGDVTQFRLGLGEKVFNDMADQVDAICHSSALVDWMRPLEDYVGPNVISTHEVLRLASSGRGKTVHLVSTVATLPRYLGYEVPKDDLEYGYATSKWMAEQMVAAARWRGAKASVYRLPFITASAATGHFRLDRGDFLHNLIVGSIEMGSFPSLDADLSIVLPVDYLAKTIVAMVTQHLARIGQDFDFLNSHAPSFSRYFELMGNASAGQGVLPFSSWRQQALHYADTHPGSALARIVPVLDGSTEESAAAMFKYLPVGKNVFGGDDHPTPSVDEQSVRKYLDRIDAARVKAALSMDHVPGKRPVKCYS